MDNKKTSNTQKSYLIKHQLENSKPNNNMNTYQINIVKTESKLDEKEKDINNSGFNKFINSQNSTYSKISQINNSNMKKNQRERQIQINEKKTLKDPKGTKAKLLNKFIDNINNNKCKSSSLSKELNEKYKNMKLKNNLNHNDDSDPQSKYFKFLNLNDNLVNNNNKKKVNKCVSADKYSYSKILNYTGTGKKIKQKKNIERERLSNSPNSPYENTTMALTYGNLPNNNYNYCNTSINNKIHKDSSFVEICKEKASIYSQKNIMEFSSPEELHFFQVNVMMTKNKLAYKFENCEENLENYDDNEIINSVKRIESDNFFGY